MSLIKFYRWPGLSISSADSFIRRIQDAMRNTAVTLRSSEVCYYVQVDKTLSEEELSKLRWMLTQPFQTDNVSKTSSFQGPLDNEFIVEIGPRLSITTPFSTNATAICKNIGLNSVSRIEYSNHYYFAVSQDFNGNLAELRRDVVNLIHDRMTEMEYIAPLQTFAVDHSPSTWFEVDVLGNGKAAFEKVNQQLGLALDEWDINFYTDLFRNKLKRNPTSVEVFDLSQSNSEHSRHWFFKGELVIDSKSVERSLFDMVMSTQNNSNPNNVIKFNDNSSAIQGFPVDLFVPEKPGNPSKMTRRSVRQHVTFSAETHNFPTAVSPFSGATTGTGGRIRDTHATGRGSLTIAATAGYCFGNLLLPEHPLPWEDPSFEYPENFAKPSQIAIEASNGASDYGNKFGEPVIAGFCRSFGLRLPKVSGETDDESNEERKDGGGFFMAGKRIEYVKPIMFSAGIGSISDEHVKKMEAEKGMLVVKLGGPVYRIGVGGGSASSVQVQGDNKAELDFNAVQRGDPEMEQKLNRVIRACTELGESNPLCSIHDQGAGGNGNVLKELVDPAGATIKSSGFDLGDPTVSVLEIWGAEYQESDAVLIKDTDKSVLADICRREKCPVSFVGEVTGNGKIVLTEGDSESINETDVRHPVDLELTYVLGQMPRKKFELTSSPGPVMKLKCDGISVDEALNRVLALPSVGSKRFLTTKVDRCVTGLVAQQQCVGPLHLPVADVAVVALSYFDTVGGATAIGEQPIKGLVDPAAGARLAVTESLTNLVFAKISNLKDVKCSGNWMYAAKLPGEGAALHSACTAMVQVMKELGIAIDGGKDSLSMAARVNDETVVSPGTLVISTYAPCTDIRLTVTPDLKLDEHSGVLLHVKLNSSTNGQWRLGGTAFAQAFSSLGGTPPNLDDAAKLKAAFQAMQALIAQKKLSAGHDISDGGFITTVLEMAFSGNRGINLDIKLGDHQKNWPPVCSLFSEEPGWVLEVSRDHLHEVVKTYRECEVDCEIIGRTCGVGPDSEIVVSVNSQLMVNRKMVDLRDVWESTSFALEMRQAYPKCVEQEKEGLKKRRSPPYRVTSQLTIDPTGSIGNPKGDQNLMESQRRRPKVAVLREEGSNGDRELAAACHLASFDVVDLTVTDLVSLSLPNLSNLLRDLQGLLFCGGFSYADVLGSGKGWAGTLLYNDSVRKELDAFRRRSDTFSLGICNGCQLMTLLGWVGGGTEEEVQTEGGSPPEDKTEEQTIFLAPNYSNRFECRFSTVRIEESSSIMLKGMESSILGIWVAHGEGRFVTRNDHVTKRLEENRLIPVRYVDDEGSQTLEYPFNPNGSLGGAAAVCSVDGRHLAMMPHPERSILTWQWPCQPPVDETAVPSTHSTATSNLKDASAMKKVPSEHATTPWMTMFTNAYDWCMAESVSCEI